MKLRYMTVAFAVFALGIANGANSVGANRGLAYGPEMTSDLPSGAMVLRWVAGAWKRYDGPSSGFVFEADDAVYAGATAVLIKDKNGCFTVKLNPGSDCAITVEDHSADGYIGLYMDMGRGSCDVTDVPPMRTAPAPIRKLRVRKNVILAGASGSGYTFEVVTSTSARISCTDDSAIAWNKSNESKKVIPEGMNGLFGSKDDFAKVALQANAP